MWLFSQLVKNFNICKHNVYCSFCMELDLLHYIWCEILLEYQLGCNIEYLEYLSVYIYIYIYLDQWKDLTKSPNQYMNLLWISQPTRFNQFMLFLHQGLSEKSRISWSLLAFILFASLNYALVNVVYIHTILIWSWLVRNWWKSA